MSTTVAPGTTAPVLSFTVPNTVPVVICARALVATPRQSAIEHAAIKLRLALSRIDDLQANPPKQFMMQGPRLKPEKRLGRSRANNIWNRYRSKLHPVWSNSKSHPQLTKYLTHHEERHYGFVRLF